MLLQCEVTQTSRADIMQYCQPPADCVHQLNNFCSEQRMVNWTDRCIQISLEGLFVNRKLTCLRHNSEHWIPTTLRELYLLLSTGNRLWLYRQFSSWEQIQELWFLTLLDSLYEIYAWQCLSFSGPERTVLWVTTLKNSGMRRKRRIAAGERMIKEE